MVTNIKQVAKHAGVSTATVSHVLNNTRYVAPETKQKVLASIKTLKFEPSYVAKSLRTKSTKIIALIVPNILDHLFGAVAHDVQESVSKEGYSVIVYNTANSSDLEITALKTCHSRRVDAIILAPLDDGEYCKKVLGRINIPVLLLDRGKALPFPLICTKNYDGALLGLKHLKECGYENILAVSPNVVSDAVLERLEACKKYGTIVTVEELSSLLAKGIPNNTGIITTNYQSTLDTLRALRKNKLFFPEDIGLVVFDDTKWIELFNPPITAIGQRVAEISQCVSTTVLNLIQDKSVPKLQEFDVVLRQRQSLRKYG